METPNWKEMLDALSPEKRAKYDAAMIDLVRRNSSTTIAQAICSVQPMPDNIDFNALGRAYSAICSMHDREPTLRGIRPSMVVTDEVED